MDKQKFLKRYVTMDELWLYDFDPETELQSQQRKYRGSPPPKIFKVTLSASYLRARMCSLLNYLQGGATITDCFCDYLITKLHASIKEKRRGKLRQGVLFITSMKPATGIALQWLPFKREASSCCNMLHIHRISCFQ